MSEESKKPVAQGEPVAWRLKDPDPHGRWEWVLYQPADFKQGINPRDAVPGLEPLYTHPQQASEPMTDADAFQAGFRAGYERRDAEVKGALA